MSMLKRALDYESESESESDNETGSLNVEVDNYGYKRQELGYGFRELGSINKMKMDFDAEKICSVTSSRVNIYCCLVCGRYFKGRSEGTPAFLHSMGENHNIYINMDNLKLFALPDNREILIEDNASSKYKDLIDDIKYVISPKYDVQNIQGYPETCHDLHNKEYLNGFVGLAYNSATWNGSIASVVMMLAHIRPARDYFLLDANIANEKIMEMKLRHLIKKIWSPKLFRSHISMDEFLAYISIDSNYTSNIMNDPKQFLLSLLNAKDDLSSPLKEILNTNLRGMVTLTSKKSNNASNDGSKDNTKERKVKVPFWLLSLDLPTTPVFVDSLNTNTLPQVKLSELLLKFNGVKEQIESNGKRKRYKLEELPNYLLLHFNRFDIKTKTPIKDRNQTLVEFPTIMELKQNKYRLMANIVLEVVQSNSSNSVSQNNFTSSLAKDHNMKWKVILRNNKDNTWYEIDGINVNKRERELLFLSETYLQLWEKIE